MKIEDALRETQRMCLLHSKRPNTVILHDISEAWDICETLSPGKYEKREVDTGDGNLTVVRRKDDGMAFVTVVKDGWKGWPRGRDNLTHTV